MSTEKEQKEGAGDAANKSTDEKADANKTIENASNDESLNESKTAEEGDKKPKKAKKKFSFRSFSFTKKDKQKPVKKEKEEEKEAEKVNGECEKVPEEVRTLFFLQILKISHVWSRNYAL